ncbi:MAG: PKD domain-containing protein [Candidatus Dormibacteria bacterium]
MKRLVPAAAILVGMGAAPLALADGTPSFQVSSFSGSNGFSFVYIRAQDDSGDHAVPNTPSDGCNAPYYADIMDTATSVTTFYAEIFYRCSDGSRVNPQDLYDLVFNLTNSDSSAVVGVHHQAGAVMPFGLSVALDPGTVRAGQPATVSAQLSAGVQSSMDRYLGINILDWSVVDWRVDFGDGQSQDTGAGGSTFQVSHVYTTPGVLNPVVTASVAGDAEIADFGGDGEPYMVTVPFGVQVTNGAGGLAQHVPVIEYHAPVVVPAVAVVADGSDTTPADTGLTSVDALRGLLTDFYMRPQVVREGYMTSDGLTSGGASTQLSSYSLTAAPGATAGPAPAGDGPGDPVSLQWDQPDVLNGGADVPYQLQLHVDMLTTFADGTHRHYPFDGPVAVQVRYSANGF